jgi:uncharacterized protein YbdZ (MbtH family)
VRSDSSYGGSGALHSESNLADYYSVESLASFDSGHESLDSLLWFGGDINISPGGSVSDETSECGSAASDTLSLPSGWQMMTTADGKPYFVNKARRITTWLDPRTNRPAAATQRPGLAPAKTVDESSIPLPEGWEMAISDTGTPYFIDHIHRKTTWTDPRTLMFEEQRESHRLRQLNAANAELRRKIEVIRKQQARLEQEMLRSASPETIGLAKIKAQADAYAILTLQAQHDTLQRQIEACPARSAARTNLLPDVPEVEPTSPGFLRELASVQRISAGGKKKKPSSRRRTTKQTSKRSTKHDTPSPTPSSPSLSPCPVATTDALTDNMMNDDVLDAESTSSHCLFGGDAASVVDGQSDSPDSGVMFDSLDADLGDVDLASLGMDTLPLSPTAVEDFFGTWSV